MSGAPAPLPNASAKGLKSPRVSFGSSNCISSSFFSTFISLLAGALDFYVLLNGFFSEMTEFCSKTFFRFDTELSASCFSDFAG